MLNCCSVICQYSQYCSEGFNIIGAILGKEIQRYNCSSVDVPLGDHVTRQLPLQVLVVPLQDLVGDVEAVVVVKLPSGEVKVPVEIAPLRQPEGGREWCGQPPRLNKS